MNTTATTIDFTSFLKLMAHQRASTCSSLRMPPAMKVNGRSLADHADPHAAAEPRPGAQRDDPAQREEFEKTHECNFAIGLSGVGRFRVSCRSTSANQVGMVLRRIETRIPTVEELSLPPIIKTLAMTKRHHPVRWCHRYRQIDIAGGDDRLPQTELDRPHHHHRRSDRVRAR